ncbi:MAG: 2-C-methyl-D-erythritol 4-phosphate cytidylyltransferase [SAR324 cluster bacterium]|nr:2-C-methyl-D-erythritol 4-phosphate cytidylyltransferase [SAR324 cluster bacterium]
MTDHDAVAVVLAAGRGTRMGENHNKLLLTLGTSTILEFSLKAFLQHPRICKVYLTVATQDLPIIEKTIPQEIVLVEGGERRQDSVHHALSKLLQKREIPELVLIHDAARPFCSAKLITKILDATLEHDAAIPVLPLVDTIRHITKDKTKVLNRKELFAVQTPQGFRTELIQEASKQAIKNNWEVTDDASLMEKTGFRVATVEGEANNLKITTPADLERANWILQSMSNS